MSKNKLNLPEFQGPFYGVTVQTWGTHDRGGNGLLEQADANLFGGNLGHASLSIKLPNNETTRKWVEQYCFNYTFEQFQNTFGYDKTFKEYLDYDNNIDITDPRAVKIRRIPVSLRKQSTRQAALDANGTPVPTSDLAFEQDYLDIEWSWWGAGPQGLDTDMEQEREGHHFEYNDKWKSYLEPEQRRHKGKLGLGYRDMDYAPLVMLHQRDLPDSELERISTPEKILELTRRIHLIGSLISKVEDLKDITFNFTMKLMLKNLGLNAEELYKEAKEYSDDQANPEESTAQFKDYIIKKLTARSDELEGERETLQNAEDQFTKQKEALEERIARLKEQLQLIRSKQTEGSHKASEEELDLLQELEQATSDLSKIEKFSPFYSEHSNAYMVVGQRPHHQITLPFGGDETMGLDPEAMLKVMNQLSDPEKPIFNITHNNCSSTCIQILEAGAEHNETLHSILGKRALGYVGTPQQVLGNAQLAKKAVDGNYTPNFLTSLLQPKFIDNSFKNAVELIVNDASTDTQKNQGYLLLIGTGIAKIPSLILESILNPKKIFNQIMGYVNVIFERETWNPWISVLLKVGVILLTFIPLVLLAPLVLIQNVLATLFQPIQSFINLFKKSNEDNDESTHNINYGDGCIGNQALALLNGNIKTKIDDNTLTVEQQKSPIDTINAFEDALIANPKKIVVLNQRAHDSILKFINNGDDTDAKQRFYTCCNLSLARVKNYTPKNKQEVNDIVGDANPAYLHAQDDVSTTSSSASCDSVEEDSSMPCSSM
jgi:hypothetical protein